ncbi:hypothetical protein GALMADRAFT_67254 [Galerina marginata CBS 339.88]|uniref:HPP transmembrane region domain-containing protein n=1 Tax=Galerina marginata (strain CBS 339.88) TaxID=685588 RepID=A0A067T9W4_GALM3|nr:hypothetical protein GALMADRAFT_67254 [Galerina marginata CBS 339.88]
MESASRLNYWLGLRSRPQTESPHVVWIWSFFGSFLGISLIQIVFGQAKYFIKRGAPSIVASYGGTAVLVYGVVHSPPAQPRPVLGGHFLSALTGICITNLFRLLPTEERFQNMLWLAGSLACAISIVVMQATGTTHPPAGNFNKWRSIGATAFLAVVNPEIREMGWYYLAVILLTSALTLVIAIINNNIQRRYPSFWFRPNQSVDFKPAPIPISFSGVVGR